MRLYYAQNREDLLIESFFPDVKKGFYVDVGANDAIIDSVTKLFYDKGWRGIHFEPIRRHVEQLKRERPQDTIINAGAGSKKGELPFREYPEGDGLSTFEQDMKDYYAGDAHPHAAANKYEEYTVPVVRVQDIFAEHKVKHIHWMKIDVEGFEYDVLAGNDWDKFRPELLCIEANHVKHDWRPLLKSHDYEKVFFDGINEYYLAKESMHRAELFSYPDAVFSGAPVYYPAYERVKADGRYEAQIEFKRTIQDREGEIAQLKDQLTNPRVLLKRFVKEVRIRIDRRAARPQQHGKSLRYREDVELKQLVASKKDPKKLLAYLQEHDAENVYLNKSSGSLKASVRRAFWVVVDAVLKAGYFGAKAAFKLLKRMKHAISH